MRRAVRLVAPALLLTVGVAAAATIVVPDDNPSIEDAVESAQAGDLIQIQPGTYSNDRIRVDDGQTGLTIEALGDVEVLVPSGADAIDIRGVDGVTVRGIGFTNGAYGARIRDAAGTTLDGLSFGSQRKDGIRLDRAPGTTITETSVLSSRGRGIRVNDSPNVTIAGRYGQFATAGSVLKEGIRVQQSDGLSITDALVTVSKRDGIRIIKCANTTLDGNIVNTSHRSGIRVQSSPNLTIVDNGSFTNGQYGFHIKQSPPVATVADLTGGGNTASGNGTLDFRVD